MAYVQEEMQSQRFLDEGWLVYTLNPTGDTLRQVAAYLYNEKFIKDTVKSSSVSLSASVLGTGGGVSYLVLCILRMEKSTSR